MSTITLGTVDLGGDGKTVLLAAVNQATGKNFTLADFDFLLPEPVTIPTPTRNTVIRLAPKAASGWYGSRKVFYNRIHVTELGDIAVGRGNATTVVGLLDQINEKYGILITAEDIYDAALPTPLPGETEVAVDFNFRPTSIIYYGGTRIILGTNDPTAPGGNTSLPFSGQTTVFAYNTTLNGSGIGSLDVTSVTVDTDKVRKRFAAMNPESSPPALSDIYTRRVEGQMVAGGTLPGFPIVDSWKGTDGAFCVDGFGQVFKLNDTSTVWVKHGDILGLDLNVPSIALSCLERPRIKAVKQGPSNSLWALAVIGGHNELFKSVDGGVTWDDQVVVATEMRSIGTVPMDYVLHDCMVHAGKLWFLFTTDTTYLDDPVGTPGALGVETIDLVTLQGTYANLWAAERKNGEDPLIPRKNGSRFTFMTPANNTTPALTVVGLVATTWTEAQLYVFRPENAVPQGYSVYDVRHEAFERDILDRESTYLQAYAVPLSKNNQLAIETIEVGSLVETSTFAPEQWIMEPVRTPMGYYSFGVKVFTRVASATQANNWVRTALPMGRSNIAYPLVLTEAGQRMHYAIQPEHAIYRVRFTEDNTIAGFVPALDDSMLLEKHAGFTHVSRHGTTAWSRPGVSETLNTSYGLVTYANTEGGKALIDYSFTGVDSLGKVHWLTSHNDTVALSHRTIGLDFAGMSEVPLAVAAQGTSLLYWSASHGIFYSIDAGHSWQRYSDARVLYSGSESNNPDYVGAADFKFQPTNFKQGSFLNNKSVFEMSFTLTAKIYDQGASNFDQGIVFGDRLLFVTDIVTGQTANPGYEADQPWGGYGVNLTSQYAPKALKAWDVDANNSVSAASLYTLDPDNPLDELSDEDDVLLGVSSNMTLYDLRRDVKYLDIDAIAWGQELVGGNLIQKLDFIKSSAVTGSFELLGGSNAPTAGFTPEVVHFLWQYRETNYVPLVYYGNKKLVLVGRLIEDGSFGCTLHNLAVPSDNGAPLVPVPMLSKNRREYLYAQKGNGVFRLNYTYNQYTRVSVFTLVRVFSLSASDLSDISIVTGACLSAADAVPPTVPLIPVFPVDGTLLYTECDGTTKNGVYADGAGGMYTAVIELDSVDCGYTAPTPTPVGANSATITLNTDTSNTSITNTDVIADEGENVYAVYALDTALNADAMVDFGFGTGTTGETADIVAFGVRVGTSGGWTTVSLPYTLTIPAGATVFAIRAQLRMDVTTEGEEKFTISVKKNVASNAQLLNGTITTEFTINDTSIAPTPPPAPVSATTVTLDTSGDLANPAALATTTASSVNEGDYINLVYKLAAPLDADANTSLWLQIGADTADNGDILEVERYDAGTSGWVAYAMTDWIPIAAGTQHVCLRALVRADVTTEGVESITLQMNIAAGPISGADPILAVFTINDTSVAPSTFSVNVDQTPQLGGHMTTLTTTAENTFVTVVYDITNPQTVDNNASVFAHVVDGGFTNPSASSDVQYWQRWNPTTSAWVSLGFSDLIPIPANSTQLVIRAFITNDGSTEGTETMTIQLSSQSTSGMAIDANIDHTLEITDAP